MYQFVLVINPFMPNGNKRLNILKPFGNKRLPPGMKGLTASKTSPIKMNAMAMTKKLNFRMHNDLQASHVISIFAVFKKLSQKRSYKMMHFSADRGTTPIPSSKDNPE